MITLCDINNRRNKLIQENNIKIRYGKKLKNYMIVICMKNKIKRGEIKMGKKKKKFKILYRIWKI